MKYLCAVQKSRFKNLCNMLSPMVTKPGLWEGAWNESTNELFVYHWSNTAGKKYVLTNALRHERRTPSKFMIPAYDGYKMLFSLCDKFNRRLHHHCWPHRHGGGEMMGDVLSINDFYFSCVLQNVNNAWIDLNVDADDFEEPTFKQFCLDLSEALYVYALHMDDQLTSL